MVAEHLQRCVADVGDAILHAVLGADIRKLLYVRAPVLHRHPMHLLVLVAIDERAFRLNEVNELGELVAVDVKGRKDIDMVPLDACDDGHVGLVEVELGTASPSMTITLAVSLSRTMTSKPFNWAPTM